MTEVTLLISAHKYDDLEADFEILIGELEAGHSTAAGQGLLQRVTEGIERFNNLKEDYIR